jgi:SAM-dependent methyltransferase
VSEDLPVSDLVEPILREELQDFQYQFPYHHIPHFDKSGTPWRVRGVGWGLEYLVYLRHIEERVRRLDPKSLLDVGCGDGRFLAGMEMFGLRRCGIDVSRRAIRFAQAFGDDIDFRVEPVLEHRSRYDLVTAIEVLEHVSDENEVEFFSAICDRVRSGGSVLITVPSSVVPTNRKHYRHYDSERLRWLLREAKISTRDIVFQFLLPRSALYELYRRVSANRYAFVEIPHVNRLMWRYLWSRRSCEEGKCTKVVMMATIE